MSKSDGTALPLSAGPDRIAAFVRSMYTDPGHLRVSDPGRVEVARLKGRYRAGGLGDGAIKRRLEELLQELIRPIRDRRATLAADPAQVLGTIRRGTERARERTRETRDLVYRSLGIGTG